MPEAKHEKKEKKSPKIPPKDEKQSPKIPPKDEKKSPGPPEEEKKKPEGESPGSPSKKNPSALSKIVKSGYHCLDLFHFYTHVNENEAKCWTCRLGTKAPQAAGLIHTDMEKGFIAVEVMKYDDYIAVESESKLKSEGKLKTHGKDYIIEDGDICHFKFNPPKK